MKRMVMALVAGTLCVIAAVFPAQAAGTGVAGIEFYYPSEGGNGGGGSGGSRPGGGSSGGGSLHRDTDPPLASAPAVQIPEDDIVWMADPGRDLGRLPETGSNNLAAALILAGCAVLIASFSRTDTPGEITVARRGCFK